MLGVLMSHMGALAVFGILLLDWCNNDYIRMEDSMSVLAIVYTLFGGVNMLVYFAYMGA